MGVGGVRSDSKRACTRRDSPASPPYRRAQRCQRAFPLALSQGRSGRDFQSTFLRRHGRTFPLYPDRRRRNGKVEKFDLLRRLTFLSIPRAGECRRGAPENARARARGTRQVVRSRKKRWGESGSAAPRLGSFPSRSASSPGGERPCLETPFDGREGWEKSTGWTGRASARRMGANDRVNVSVKARSGALPQVACGPSDGKGQVCCYERTSSTQARQRLGAFLLIREWAGRER